MNSIFVLVVLAIAIVIAVVLSVKDDIEAADQYKLDIDDDRE